jgi:AcrR family transcriptional regulator
MLVPNGRAARRPQRHDGREESSDMTDSVPGGKPRPSLRERKKARTRAQLQAEALRLFHEQGYTETTIEQVAEAADVSPTTVYRYFPTKPDLVIYDDLDDRLIEAFRAQPPGMSALQALRASLAVGFGVSLGEQLAVQRERERLIRTEPELRAAMLDELTRTLDEIALLISERSGRPAQDDEVVALAGGVLGVIIAAWFGTSTGDWVERFMARVDRGLALLESGFDL